MPGERFTAWFSQDELDAVVEVATDADTSKNFVVRTCVRAVLLGKPVPRWLRETVATDATDSQVHVLGGSR